MVSPEVQRGTGAFDLHFSAQSKPNAAVLGRTVHCSELIVADSQCAGHRDLSRDFSVNSPIVVLAKEETKAFLKCKGLSSTC